MGWYSGMTEETEVYFMGEAGGLRELRGHGVSYDEWRRMNDHKQAAKIVWLENQGFKEHESGFYWRDSHNSAEDGFNKYRQMLDPIMIDICSIEQVQEYLKRSETRSRSQDMSMGRIYYNGRI